MIDKQGIIYSEDGKTVIGVVDDFSATEIVIPEGVTKIEYCALRDTGITKVQLPKSLQILGANFHAGDINILVEEPYEILHLYGESYFLDYGNIPVKKIVLDGTYAMIVCANEFEGNEYLEEVVISNDIEEIEDNAFAGCINLRKVTFKGSCDLICKGAFVGCDNLEEINIPADAEVEDGAFDGKNIWRNKFVDLGLPSGTLWCRTNVGADCPLDSGTYFAWGEYGQTKRVYSWDTYLDCEMRSDIDCGTNKDILKNFKTISKTEFDAAFIRDRSSQIPSCDAYRELVKILTWEPKKDDGKTIGWIGRSQNGCSVYFPFTGCIINKEKHPHNEYWTSEKHTSFEECAMVQDFNLMGPSEYLYHVARCSGRPIRAIWIR